MLPVILQVGDLSILLLIILAFETVSLLLFFSVLLNSVFYEGKAVLISHVQHLTTEDQKGKEITLYKHITLNSTLSAVLYETFCELLVKSSKRNRRIKCSQTPLKVYLFRLTPHALKKLDVDTTYSVLLLASYYSSFPNVHIM